MSASKAMRCVVALFITLSTVTAFAAGGWNITTSTISSPGRYRFKAITLLDNRIMYIGGNTGDFGGTQPATNACDFYNPATNTFTAAPSMLGARYAHGVVRLADGRVLALGGIPGNTCTPLTSCEIFSTTTSLWTSTASLPSGVSDPAVVLLPNGKVLLSGGGNAHCAAMVTTCRLFDPAGNSGAGSWTLTGSMGTPRIGHRMMLLDNGKVLVVGGRISSANFLGTNVTQLYDPALGTWSNTTGTMTTARGAYTDASFTLTKMADGRVICIGGNTGAPGVDTTLASCEIYNPTTGLWTLGPQLPEPRELHSAALLPNGGIVVVGGRQNSVSVQSSYTLYPGASTWLNGYQMVVPRDLIEVSVLPDGTLLAPMGTSGVNWTGIQSAEIFTSPGITSASNWQNFQ